MERSLPGSFPSLGLGLTHRELERESPSHGESTALGRALRPAGGQPVESPEEVTGRFSFREFMQIQVETGFGFPR